jgi:ATP-dependent DNA helicase DinG
VRRARATTFFGDGGLLAQALPAYEERLAQQRLSEAVERTLRDGGVLVAEAGTGTGKTLAYLFPVTSLDRRVVVSTGTKNLQEQLVQKDLPVLARALGRKLKVAVMKGRGNYLCLLRFDSFREAGTVRRPDEIPLLNGVKTWAGTTQTGDRSEIEDLPDNAEFWREISASSDNCIGQNCPLFDSCYVTRMRQRATEADIVVVNHHLLCADLSVKDGSYGQVIPPYDTVILDEAHLLEDVAAQHFGIQVSSHRIDDLCRDTERELRAAKLDAREVLIEVDSLRHRGETFFQALSKASGRRLAPDSLSPRILEEARALLLRLDGLRSATLAVSDTPEPLVGLAARALALRAETEFALGAEDDGYVHFVETRGRGVYLRATPIDVSQRLQEALFASVRSAVLTSATLSVDGGFAYLRSRLGIVPTEELLLPSPFAFEEQAVLYVPKSMPEPLSPDFPERVAEEVIRILRISRGRAFVLFTSYANMNTVAAHVASGVSWPIFVQGEAPRSLLLDTFRRTPNAVLFATASFWQGVDVQGEQLSCVIIDKLPFASPSDPLVAARIDHLKRAGQNAFADFQVPVAILALKQGLGRLIRSATDRGILAVLDSRLVKKSYGRRFLTSLPPARLVHDLAAVEEFMY